ncbi:YhcB family protein [Testudinibacter sp. P27/CKL/0425]
MESTSAATNVWLIGLIGAVIGFILAYVLIKMTSGNVKKQQQTASELKQVKTEVEQQKAKIEEHFAESAELLKSMAQDYQRLYKHLATSSVALLPEAKAKAIFDDNLLLAEPTVSEPVVVEADLPTEAQQNEAAATPEVVDKDQPKDYSKGSSGLLKAKES